MMRVPTYALLVMAMAACSTAPSQHAASVKEADDKMVADCEFLGSVSGFSGFGGPGGSGIGMARSKNSAREQAADKGATHVVWLTVAGGYNSSATGKAYKC